MKCSVKHEALSDLKKNKQKSALPEIMIPLVSTEAEIKIMKNLVLRLQGKFKIKIK